MDSSNLEQEFEKYASIVRNLSAIDEAMLSEIQSSLTSVKNTIDILKTVDEITKKIENAELLRAISSLNLELSKADLELATAEKTLAAAIRQATQLEEENIQLKAKIQKLEAGDDKPKLIRGKNSYWAANGDGPYCSGCYESRGKAYSLSDFGGVHTCPICSKPAMGVTKPAGI